MCKIVIIGATGAVGQELLYWIHRRALHYTSLKLVASSYSQGRSVHYEDKVFKVEALSSDTFKEADLAVFCVDDKISREWVPKAVSDGCLVIDGSSAFRLEPNVPLVVPEINPDFDLSRSPIISSPNCTATIALMALYPLHQAFGLKSFFASSYQAVSGSGVAAVQELEAQTKASNIDTSCALDVYPHPIAFNLFPHVGGFDPLGNSGEEQKFIAECRKILKLPALNISITCVRVPVKRAHSVAIHASFEKEVPVGEARLALANFEGIVVMDKPEEAFYPTPQLLTCKDYCGVGRIRQDQALLHGLAFWVVGDQLWKGAALNMAQLMELVSQKLVAA